MLNELIKKRLDELGLSAYRIAQLTKIGQGAIHQALAGKRGYSLTMLEELATIEGFGYTADQLLAMKVLEEYQPSAIVEAYHSLVDKGLVQPIEQSQFLATKVKPSQQPTEQGG